MTQPPTDSWRPPEAGNPPQFEPPNFAASHYGQPQPYGGQPHHNPDGPSYPAQAAGTPPPYGLPQYSRAQYGQAGQAQYGQAQYGLPQYGALQPAVARKEPGLALLVSFFVPGVGTIMNGETGKGVAILVGYLVCWALSWLLVPLVGVFGLWIWGMVDAYQGAQRYNMAHGLRP